MPLAAPRCHGLWSAPNSGTRHGPAQTWRCTQSCSTERHLLSLLLRLFHCQAYPRSPQTEVACGKLKPRTKRAAVRRNLRKLQLRNWLSCRAINTILESLMWVFEVTLRTSKGPDCRLAGGVDRQRTEGKHFLCLLETFSTVA